MPLCVECSSIDGVDVRGSRDGLSCDNCGRMIQFDRDMCLIVLSDLRKGYEPYLDKGGSVAYYAKLHVDRYNTIREKVLDGSLTSAEEFIRLTYL